MFPRPFRSDDDDEDDSDEGVKPQKKVSLHSLVSTFTSMSHNISSRFLGKSLGLS